MARRRDTFTVIYRTGGTARFRWNRVLEAYSTSGAAIDVALELERQGYATRVHSTSRGLPETYA